MRNISTLITRCLHTFTIRSLSEKMSNILLNIQQVYTEMEPSLKLVFPMRTLRSTAFPSRVSF